MPFIKTLELSTCVFIINCATGRFRTWDTSCWDVDSLASSPVDTWDFYVFFPLIANNVLLGSVTNMSIAKHFWMIHSSIYLNDPLWGFFFFFLLHLSNTTESFTSVPVNRLHTLVGILTTVKTMYLPFTGHLSLLCLSANHLNRLDSFLDSMLSLLPQQWRNLYHFKKKNLNIEETFS